MSKIKNGGLNQYGKVWSINRIGDERVNSHSSNFTFSVNTVVIKVVNSIRRQIRRIASFVWMQQWYVLVSLCFGKGKRLIVMGVRCVLGRLWHHCLIVINTWRLQLNNSDLDPLYKFWSVYVSGKGKDWSLWMCGVS